MFFLTKVVLKLPARGINVPPNTLVSSTARPKCCAALTPSLQALSTFPEGLESRGGLSATWECAGQQPGSRGAEGAPSGQLLCTGPGGGPHGLCPTEKGHCDHGRCWKPLLNTPESMLGSQLALGSAKSYCQAQEWGWDTWAGRWAHLWGCRSVDQPLATSAVFL